MPSTIAHRRDDILVSFPFTDLALTQEASRGGRGRRRCRPSQPSTRSAISGALSRIRSNVLAAPVGPRLPCSQLRIVSCDTSMRRANSTCVRPVRLRTRRANRAMSRIASASSSRLLRDQVRLGRAVQGRVVDPAPRARFRGRRGQSSPASCSCGCCRPLAYSRQCVCAQDLASRRRGSGCRPGRFRLKGEDDDHERRRPANPAGPMFNPPHLGELIREEHGRGRVECE